MNRRRPSLPCLVAGILLAASQTEASEWPDSFSGPAVSSYLESSTRAVLVAGAGNPSDEVGQAVTALEGALRTIDRLQLVMNAAGLGDLSGDSDAQVVAKAATLPVDAIAIVRVFPGGGDNPPTAVVTVFDKAGKAHTAFSTQRGVSLQPKAGGGVGAGVSPSAMNALEGIEKAGTDGQASFEERSLRLAETQVVNPYGLTLGRFFRAYRGSSGVPLSSEEFYLALGREDLANSFSRSNGLRWGLFAGGLVGAAAGAAAFSYGNTGRCIRRSATDQYGCLETDGEWLRTPGLVLMIAGGLAIPIGIFLDPHPIDANEARRLVDQHNARLKVELGLAAAASPTTPARLHLGLVAFPGGAGLNLQGPL